MPAYEETLDALRTKLIDYLKKTEAQTSQEIISFVLTNNLRTSVENYIKKMKLFCRKIKPQEMEYSSAFDSLTKEYSKREKELENLEDFVKEVQAQLSLSNDLDYQLEVLTRYDIIDKKTKKMVD